MAEPLRKGRQTPTQSYRLDYEKSLYKEAVSLYSASGNTAIEWQESLLKDIMAVRDDGLWIHTKIGYSVPRRNGKTESIYMREQWGLEHGEQIAHTAHLASTSHSSYERMVRLLIKSGYKEREDFISVKTLGAERIELVSTGGCIKYRTRTGQGGLGEGFDLLVIDEAQEYTATQASALKYTVSDSMNPQTIMCGTPPTVVSKGEEFPAFRKKALAGQVKNALWAEWSVDEMTDLYDKEAWYKTNPSMGYHLNERKIEDEIGSDEVDFNIQRLGLWISYSQKSAISRPTWLSCTIDKSKPPAFKSSPYVAIKYSKDAQNVVMAIAVKTALGVFVEALDCRPITHGNDWITAFLIDAEPQKVVVDGASGIEQLLRNLKDAKVKKAPTVATTKDVIDANALFEVAINQKTLSHADQPSLTEVVTNCEHRAIGSNGGFGYVSLIKERDVTLVEAVSLAHWLCATDKPKKRRRISY